MVSKTKTKAKKKGKQTKGSKKPKSTPGRKSGIKKSNQRKTSSAVSRTRKASGKPKKTTTTPISSTIATSAQEAKLLDNENMAASSLDEDTSPQTQEESVPEVIHPVDEDIPPSTAIADEVADSDDDNTVTESM